jgi:hypothetical protein
MKWVGRAEQDCPIRIKIKHLSGRQAASVRLRTQAQATQLADALAANAALIKERDDLVTLNVDDEPTIPVPHACAELVGEDKASRLMPDAAALTADRQLTPRL